MSNGNKSADKTQETFNIKEAAKFLGVSVVTLKRWRKSGKLVPDTISQTFLQEPHKRGRKLVTNYSLAQLKLVSNSRYEHQKLVSNSETDDKFNETGIKFDETSAKLEDSQPKKVTNSKPDLIYVVEGAETLIQNAKLVSPTTLY